MALNFVLSFLIFGNSIPFVVFLKEKNHCKFNGVNQSEYLNPDGRWKTDEVRHRGVEHFVQTDLQPQILRCIHQYPP